MATLKQDIKTQSSWIVKAFKADKLTLDYTINSFKNLDKFFEKHSKDGKAKRGGRLSTNLGPILFSIGAYIGETLIKTFPGSKWITDDNDPEGELNVEIKFPNGSIVWPTQRVMKRFKNGAEDSLFDYGFLIAKQNGLELPFEIDESKSKPWWKFW